MGSKMDIFSKVSDDKMLKIYHDMLESNMIGSKSIDIACRVMSAALSSGIDSDEDGSISEAIEELSLLKNKCSKAKGHAKNEI